MDKQMFGDAISFAASVFMITAGPIFKGALGGADDATLALAKSALSGNTLGSQLSYLIKNGTGAVQLVTAGAEVTASAAEGVATDILVAGGDAIGGDNTIDLAPSAAGPGWNAPPTVEVAPLPATDSYAAIEIVTPPVIESVSTSIGGGMAVGAGASA